MGLEKIKLFFKKQYFILLIITLAALFVRLLNIDRPDGLWYDEMLTYFFSSESFPLGILKTLWRNDYHMPLYYIYVHFWMKFLGTNDVILRLSSVFWGVLSVPAFFYLGEIYKSKKLGYFLAVISAFSPIMIYYSQEFRFYSMLIFFTIISLIFFLKLLEEPNKKNFFLFGSSNLIILYIYTMGILFVGLETLILLIDFYLYKKDAFHKLIKYLFVFFILSIPYFVLLFSYSYFANQVIIGPFDYAENLTAYFILAVINNFFSPLLTCIMGIMDFNNFAKGSPLGALLITFLIIPTECFLLGLVASFSNLNKKFLYMIIILLAIILIYAGLSVNGKLAFALKYMIIMLPIVLLICSDGLLSIRIKFIKLTCICLIFLVYFYNILNYKFMPAFNNYISGYKQAAMVLNDLTITKEDYVLFLNGSGLFKKYSPNGNFIPLNYHEIICLDKTKTEALKMFNKEFVSAANSRNSMSKLKPYLLSSKPTPELENFINSYIEKIHKSNRLIYIDEVFDVKPDIVRDFVKKYESTKLQGKFDNRSLFGLFYIRFKEDLSTILNNNKSLKEKESFIVDCGKKMQFTVYEKQ